MNATPEGGWVRRARPMLGTLVEVGWPGAEAAGDAAAPARFEAVWRLLGDIQSQLSLFDSGSDLGRLHASPPGTPVSVRAHTAQVLEAARYWAESSGGAFDLAQGSGPWHWDGTHLWRLDARTRLDAGGLAKGYAIDAAVEFIRSTGCPAAWVNAGGDLRVFGPHSLPLMLRDEQQGGTRLWGWLQDGASATSHFGPGARSRLAPAAGGRLAHGHLSVLAPTAMAADALTKVLAQWHDWPAGWLARHAAHAWSHERQAA